MITFREKSYTKYDETDALKQMKDSDILAEKKKSTGGPDLSSATKPAAVGALAGGLLGGKGIKARGKAAMVGAGIGAGLGLLNSYTKKKSENNFYNKRLDMAQKYARRREKIDWNKNMRNRTGYTY